MTHLKDFNAFKLNKSKMNALTGGIGSEEYCTTLYNIWKNNDLDDAALQGFYHGWRQGECHKYYPLAIIAAPDEP